MWGGQTDVHCTDLSDWLAGAIVGYVYACAFIAHALPRSSVLLSQSLALFFFCFFFLLALYPLPPFFSLFTHSFVQGGWFVVKVRHYISGFYVLVS